MEGGKAARGLCAVCVRGVVQARTGMGAEEVAQRGWTHDCCYRWTWGPRGAITSGSVFFPGPGRAQ